MSFPCTTVCFLRGHLQKRPQEKVPRGVPEGPSSGGAQDMDRKQEEEISVCWIPMPYEVLCWHTKAPGPLANRGDVC